MPFNIETADPRCVEFDHNFDMDEMYDPETREPYSPEVQLASQCLRCGESLRESCERMSTALKQLVVGGS